MVALERTPARRRNRTITVDWETWRDGYNSLLRPTELKPSEFAQADNIMLLGSGVPTGRWGSDLYFNSGSTGIGRGLGAYATGSSLTEVIALSDSGYLVKKDGASYSVISGQSYPSGTVVRSESLGGATYFVSKDVPFTVYNGSNLQVFATISAPTGLSATNYSGVSGPASWSWKVVTLSSNGGQTDASSPTVLASLPEDLTRTSVHVRWTAPSAASISGYEIYRGHLGDETLLAAVGASTTMYIDVGDTASETILPPTINNTGGVKAKIIAKINDRLIVVPADDPNKLMISARYPYQTKFSWVDGGGYIYVDPNPGDEITGVAPQLGGDKIIVFKKNGSYSIVLNTVTIGNYIILDPQYQPISTLVGNANPETIQTVENDQFYFGRKGVYVVGYEPNFLNLIRTNEVSARIRPYIEGLSQVDFDTACSIYVNNKYIISFPERKEMVAYDRERGCWLGIWKLPYGISHMKKIVDGSGTERWILQSNNSPNIYKFETSMNSDSGATITKTIRTKKEYLGSWSMLKTIQRLYYLFRNVTGTVNVNVLLEHRDGTVSTAKTFTITGSEVAGSSGWGVDLYGSIGFGLTSGTIIDFVDEITKWSQLYKTARSIQFEISCTAANSNFELLGLKTEAQPQTSGQLPASQRV